MEFLEKTCQEVAASVAPRLDAAAKNFEKHAEKIRRENDDFHKRLEKMTLSEKFALIAQMLKD